MSIYWCIAPLQVTWQVFTCALGIHRRGAESLLCVLVLCVLGGECWRGQTEVLLFHCNVGAVGQPVCQQCLCVLCLNACACALVVERESSRELPDLRDTKFIRESCVTQKPLGDFGAGDQYFDFPADCPMRLCLSL